MRRGRAVAVLVVAGGVGTVCACGLSEPGSGGTSSPVDASSLSDAGVEVDVTPGTDDSSGPDGDAPYEGPVDGGPAEGLGDGGCAQGSCVAEIATGTTDTCAVTLDGRVYCWGKNDKGQLGNGSTTDSSSPSLVIGLSGPVAHMSLGGGHSCASLTDGTVECWGQNSNGQLGDGTTTDHATPLAVAGLTGIKQIALGTDHSCALTAASVVYCWGKNDMGQVGNNSSQATVSAPIAVIAGLSLIAAGGDTTCALSATNVVLCWGANGDSQLGDGTTTNRLYPVSLPVFALTIADLTVGAAFTCALFTTRDVSCWGANGFGQYGDGTTNANTSPATPVALMALAFSAGGYFSCGIRTGSAVFCEGQNETGELGNGTHDPPPKSNPNPGATNPVLHQPTQISTRFRHACALLPVLPRVYCWGQNDNGELGDGTTTEHDSPTPVLFP